MAPSRTSCLALVAFAGCAPVHTVEAVPGWPHVRYDRTMADGAWSPEDVAHVLDVEARDEPDARFSVALSRLEVVVIDNDFSSWQAAAFAAGARVEVGRGDEHLRDADAGVTDAERWRVLVALRRPDGSARSLGSSALVHELEHIRCAALYGDADVNHGDAPGPWDAGDDARILRVTSAL